MFLERVLKIYFASLKWLIEEFVAYRALSTMNPDGTVYEMM